MYSRDMLFLFCVSRVEKVKIGKKEKELVLGWSVSVLMSNAPLRGVLGSTRNVAFDV